METMFFVALWFYAWDIREISDPVKVAKRCKDHKVHRWYCCVTEPKPRANLTAKTWILTWPIQDYVEIDLDWPRIGAIGDVGQVSTCSLGYERTSGPAVSSAWRWGLPRASVHGVIGPEYWHCRAEIQSWLFVLYAFRTSIWRSKYDCPKRIIEAGLPSWVKFRHLVLCRHRKIWWGCEVYPGEFWNTRAVSYVQCSSWSYRGD